MTTARKPSINQAAADRIHIDALKAVLREREQELLEIKGDCSNKRCSLHYAHRGPCDERVEP